MTQGGPGNPPPDPGHAPGGAAPSWFGHPRLLARLFATEMWERMGFYGMRALLTLYLTKHFLLGDRAATGLYGGFTALVFLTPLAGGLVADRVLGAKRSVRLGAVLMAAGYFALAFGGSPARPWIAWDGVRHEVNIVGQRDGPSSDSAARSTIRLGGEVVALAERADGSLALLDAAERPLKVIPRGAYRSGSTSDPARVWLLLAALSLIAVGNGFFKPNISTMVGALYAAGDSRRDAGFTIFYMGINLGSILGQFLCPLLADRYGWGFGFALAGCGMIAAWCLVTLDGGRLAGAGEPPAVLLRWPGLPGIVLLALAAVPLFALAFSQLLEIREPAAGAGILAYVMGLPVMGKVLFGTFALGVPAILAWAWRRGSAGEFRMMLAAMILVSFNCVFWSLFEQAGSSLTLFADRNTDRSVFGLFTMSAPQTQNFNSVSIVVLAPLVSAAWARLARRGWEPSVPVKFAMALAGAGAGFLLLVLGTSHAGADGRVGLGWLAGLYVIHSLAELLISPVGLSMITGLAMARIAGLMMGVWFLSIAMGEFVAGLLAQLASVSGGGIAAEGADSSQSLAVYAHVFTRIGWSALGLSMLLLLLAKPLTRLMRGEPPLSR
jgi:POT family proton-dependent oligopeptide transporter